MRSLVITLILLVYISAKGPFENARCQNSILISECVVDRIRIVEENKHCLEELRISFCNRVVYTQEEIGQIRAEMDSLFYYLAKLPKLRKLTISGYLFKDFSLESSDFDSLAHLLIENSDTLEKIEFNASIDALEYLSVRNVPYLNSEELMRNLEKFPKLSHLDLISVGIDTIYSDIRNCRKLKYLVINNNGLISHIDDSLYDLPSLKVISIVGTKFNIPLDSLQKRFINPVIIWK